jgi:RsiW-degrading membrane proteinase PrsW (M82 family)
MAEAVKLEMEPRAKSKRVRRWASNRDDAFEELAADVESSEEEGAPKEEVPKLMLPPPIKSAKGMDAEKSADIAKGRLKAALFGEVVDSSCKPNEEDAPRKPEEPIEAKWTEARGRKVFRSKKTGFDIFKFANSFLDDCTGNTGGKDSDSNKLFSEVFKDHGLEAARDLVRGAPKDDSGRPWLFFQMFACLLTGFSVMQSMESLIVMLRGFNSSGAMMLFPGIILVGSIAAPFAYCMFFHETNRPRNIKLSAMIATMAFCWLLSFIASFAYSVVWSRLWSQGLGMLVTAAYAVIRELMKILVIYFMLKGLSGKWILNGLAIGCAAGAGFTVFDTSGAAISAYLVNYGFSIHALREFLFSFGGHVLWSAVLGAAISMSSDLGDFKISKLFRGKFLKIAAFAVAAGVIWEVFSYVFTEGVLPVIAFAAITALGLAFAGKLLNAGFKEHAGHAAKEEESVKKRAKRA